MIARKVHFSAALLLLLSAGATLAGEPYLIDVWPGVPPGQKGDLAPDKVAGAKPNRRVSEVTKPTLTVYRPEGGKNAGVAVLVAPGGGYQALMVDHEGEDVAKWLNSLGVTAAVLRYRIPQPRTQSRDANDFPPHRDAQRALSLMRSKAAEWGVDPNKIGMIGFSAGGHLTTQTATNYEKRAYEPVDAVDSVSCKPDFAIIVYPGGTLVKSKDALVPDLKFTKDTPPCFLVMASNDPVGPENCIQIYLAALRAKSPVEMHLYSTGGHGFGLRPSKNPCSQWPKACEAWMKISGILPADAK